MALIKPAPAPPAAVAAAVAAWPFRKRVTVTAALLVLACAMAALSFLFLSVFPPRPLPMPGGCAASDLNATHKRDIAEQMVVATAALLLAAAAAAAVPCPTRVLLNIADCAVVAAMACGALDRLWVAVACHGILHGATAGFFWFGVAAAIATPLVGAAVAIRRPLAEAAGV
ncbi:hypothetical protein ACP70R_042314 [Stipagrostis hirtigluma subsp. patula]